MALELEPNGAVTWRPSTPPLARKPTRLGRLDDVRITVFGYRQAPLRLTNSVVSLSWSDDADRASVEASLAIDDSEDVARKALAPGSWLEVELFDSEKGRYVHILPRLYVWSRALTDRQQGIATIEAFDVCSFLQRQGPATYFFRKNKKHPKGWTASEVATQILGDLDIPARVVPTAYRFNYLKLTSTTPYEAILKAFARDNMATGARYRIRAAQYDVKRGGLIRLDTVVIDPVVQSDYTWELAEGSNLLSANWTESLENVSTEFIGIAMSETTGKELRRIRVLSRHTPRYGRLRRVELMEPGSSPAEMEKRARSLVNQFAIPHREASVVAEGVPILRACDSVVVRESGTKLSGVFFIKGAQHQIESGTHTMSVDLSYTQTFPVIEFAADELAPGVSATGTTSTDSAGTKGEKAVAFARQQMGEPYLYGGTGPNSWDCSGLTQAAWAAAGVSIPRTVETQQSVGSGVGSATVAGAGDLLIRRGGPGRSWHVGMATGAGTVIHAPHTGDVVKEVPIASFAFDFIRRPTGSGGGSAGAGGTAGSDVVEFLPPDDEYLFVESQFSGSSSGSGGGTDYPGADAGQQQVARWMAGKARQAGIPELLPVMAALAESNLDMSAIGDSGKAVGFFQIHAARAIGNGGTAEDRTSAEWQINWFLSEANKLKSQYAPLGEAGYHRWIQAIEKSGTPSGSQYRAQLAKAKELIGSG